MKVLLVDDDVKKVEALKTILQGVGYKIYTTSNCADAFKLVWEDGFELIITSILHPVYDGLRFCHRLKSDDKTKNIPVIISVPGAFDKADFEYLSNLGADEIIGSDESKSEVVTKIINLMDNIRTGLIRVRSPSFSIDTGILQNYSRHFLEKIAGITARYQTLFDSAADGIMILRDYRFVEFNEKALEMFGCDANDIIGKFPYDFSPEFQPDGRKSKEKAIAMMDEAISGKPKLFEWRHKKLDGNLFDAEVSLRRFDLIDGVYLLALVRDITERKRFDEQLRQSEELFRTVFDSVQDCIFIKDRSLKYMKVNQCTARLFGITCEEMVGKTDYDFFAPATAEEIMNEDKRVLNGEFVESFPVKKIAGGSVIKFHTIKVPLRDSEGDIWGICGIARDITEYDRAQEIVRKNEARFKLISENIAEVTFILDLNLKSRFISPSVHKMLGYQISELLSKELRTILTAESNQEVLKVFQEELLIEQNLDKDMNRYRTLSLEVVRKDGSKLWTETTLRFIRDEAGNPIEIVGVMRDISEVRKAHHELMASYERLDKLLGGTVLALASAVEKRDPYTAGHQRRVAKLACAIAREMGLSDEVISYLNIAGLLHDIGKIYVPAEILAKPSKLTPAEFEIVKTHCQVGFEILMPIEFPWPIPDIVLQHHEKNDGSGYPYGLTKDKILNEAKILCVADIVEAMMSHRPYREALGLDQALGDVKKGRGILFEPDIVDICVMLFREKGFRFAG